MTKSADPCQMSFPKANFDLDLHCLQKHIQIRQYQGKYINSCLAVLLFSVYLITKSIDPDQMRCAASDLHGFLVHVMVH